jgi:8-oxo-dGTP pyrophosphatase MutT (NUDIX family)
MKLAEAEIRRRLGTALQTARGSADGFSKLDVDDATNLKCAAVVILLLHKDDDWHVLYTRRTETVENHKGQVSFPGGACDEGEETPEQTALRELKEEIGVEPTGVRLLGRLVNMVTVTDFRVTPVVGIVEWPIDLEINGNEVDRVFTIPLEWLADSRNRWQLPFPDRPRQVVVFRPYDGELVWGATASMTVDLIHAIGVGTT